MSGGSAGSWYTPSAPDTAVRGLGSTLDVASTVTPGSTAALESVILPLMDPNCCASAGTAARVSTRHKNVRTRRAGIHPPPRSRVEMAGIVSRRCVGVNGGPKQPGLGVEDDGDRDRGHERGERLLGAEGVEEQARGEQRQDLRGDAAADVEPRRGQGAEG